MIPLFQPRFPRHRAALAVTPMTLAAAAVAFWIGGSGAGHLKQD